MESAMESVTCEAPPKKKCDGKRNPHSITESVMEIVMES